MVSFTEDIAKAGAIGFGEIAIEHLSSGRGAHPYESVPADHPLLFALVDVASRLSMPVDIHRPPSGANGEVRRRPVESSLMLMNKFPCLGNNERMSGTVRSPVRSHPAWAQMTIARGLCSSIRSKAAMFAGKRSGLNEARKGGGGKS